MVGYVHCNNSSNRSNSSNSRNSRNRSRSSRSRSNSSSSSSSINSSISSSNSRRSSRGSSLSLTQTDSHSSFSYSMGLCQKLCVKSVIQVSISLIPVPVILLISNWLIGSCITSMQQTKPAPARRMSATVHTPCWARGRRRGAPGRVIWWRARGAICPVYSSRFSIMLPYYYPN